MKRTVKREREATGNSGGGREADDEEPERLRSVKKEKQRKTGDGSLRIDEPPPTQEEEEQGISDRRILRSQYLALQTKISDSKDDLMRIDSDKFTRIINEVENLHQHVRKPREQIADAEALLDIANTLMTSVKSQSSHGVSPAEFVNALISGFGQGSLEVDADETAQVSMKWKDLGVAVCSTVLVSCGCSTMLGPMDTELKQKKRAANRKRTKLGEGVRPDEVDDTQSEEKTDTDKNMAIMFTILGRKKRVRLENLVLNRWSFAQTVENLFALSFLAKDGRVEIIVDKSGSHFALPRNGPAAELVMSGEVTYNHFVFRLDFKDWKLMSEVVPLGEELMPHREIAVASSSCPSAPADFTQDSQTTPIRKLSRNRGLVVQEETVVEDTPDIKGDGTRRRCKRRLTSS
ncbi:PREDICTED: non-structural maintenance of chromosomes element 4 homolog A-like [Camelina sativa]|uniref:Non-structural maintenance of chromosomes element 4 n=1 Tax=Camelina sativa TaxID=90675 RepID=A0ABM0VW55_CAMSA|nr:PREDICTED: non-structural maintenance of chromosomes element 4 homolog A-like [Camelina sativa]